jgi:hypothetical protein
MILRISLRSLASTVGHLRRPVIKHGVNFGNVSLSSTLIQGRRSYFSNASWRRQDPTGEDVSS